MIWVITWWTWVFDLPTTTHKLGILCRSSECPVNKQSVPLCVCTYLRVSFVFIDNSQIGVAKLNKGETQNSFINCLLLQKYSGWGCTLATFYS